MISIIFFKNYAGLGKTVWSTRITPAPEICIILYIIRKPFPINNNLFYYSLNNSYFKIVMLALIVIKVFIKLVCSLNLNFLCNFRI